MSSGIPLVSLYSGIGGLDAGFASLGFSPRFANDIDPYAKAAYNSVLQSTVSTGVASHEYIVDDLSASLSDLPRNNDSVLVGGPPCQGFSRAGRMDPLDKRSMHVRNFVKGVVAVSPRAFVMENVAALATNERWRPVLQGVRRAARRAGYSTTLIVLDAADYGVPQARKRMFLVGLKDGSRQTLRQMHVGSPLMRSSVREALNEINPYHLQPDSLKSTAKITPALRPVIRTSPFAGMPFNGQGRFLNLEGLSPTISASLGGNHTPIVDQNWLDNPDEGGAAIHDYVAALHQGASRQVSPSWRRISVPEAGRLQGFPNGIVWSTPKSASYRQIGNAVPPPLAAEVARRLLRVLGETSSTPSEQRNLAA